MSDHYAPNDKKIGLVFSGGPAPGANAVISAITISFISKGYTVVGFMDGYKHIVGYEKGKTTLKEGIHYKLLQINEIGAIRNQRGIYIRTSRINPGKAIQKLEDLKDNKKNNPLRNLLDALEFLNIGLLISIGGDDTLRTANLIHLMGMPTIHIPKTIDNDYYGIPWTFGYWTSVDVAQKTLLNLRSDAAATNSYFVAEIMGRKTGWLTYAAGIAGEAIEMISVEDIESEAFEVDLIKICEELVDIILTREKLDKHYGIICVAEGLADKLPETLLPTVKDEFGHKALGKAEIGKVIASKVQDIYLRRTNNSLKINAKQIGYETRTASPISFDVVLASALGYGAYKLYSENKTGHMVSVLDNFNIKGIKFKELIDKNTLTTKVRFVPHNDDFYNIKKMLSYRSVKEWRKLT